MWRRMKYYRDGIAEEIDAPPMGKVKVKITKIKKEEQ